MRRVVITGAGVVSSLGADLDTFWNRCLAGETCVEPIPAAWLRYSTFRSRLWSPLGAWERETPLVGRLERKQLDGTNRLALQAAEEALRRAGFPLEQTDVKRNTFRPTGIAPDRSGIFLGTGIGGLQSCLESSRFVLLDRAKRQLAGVANKLRERSAAGGAQEPGDPCAAGDPRDAGDIEAAAEIEAVLESLPAAPVLNPFSIAMTMPNASAATLSIKLGFSGPSVTYSCACASGTVALGRAFRALRDGECDLALAGGVELLSDPLGCCFRGFDALGVLVSGDGPPDRVNRPFDRCRTGFLFSEGGGAIVVLEELEAARRRGAPVIAEIAGYAETSDAYSIMGMAPDGAQIRRALNACLADARFDGGQIDYINAHGTGTPTNDALEAGVLGALFPRRPAVNSTKSLIGHSLGASGAIEAVVAALSLECGTTHPCRNLDEPIADLDFVRRAERFDPRRALSLSFAFGGQNAALALQRVH